MSVGRNGRLVSWSDSQTFEMHKMAESDVFLPFYHLSCLTTFFFILLFIHSFNHPFIHSKTCTQKFYLRGVLISHNLAFLKRNAQIIIPLHSSLFPSFHMSMSVHPYVCPFVLPYSPYTCRLNLNTCTCTSVSSFGSIKSLKFPLICFSFFIMSFVFLPHFHFFLIPPLVHNFLS